MASVLGTEPYCSIARSLEVVGEKWTLLVLREAFRGRTRFSEFTAQLGIAKDVLANRLATLVDSGVLEKRAYRSEGERERFEYVLTAAGGDLLPVLGALAAWGDAHRPTSFSPVTTLVERSTGATVTLALVASDGRVLQPGDVKTITRGD